jgi:5-methylcytosine-specific restriction enzyme A
LLMLTLDSWSQPTGVGWVSPGMASPALASSGSFWCDKTRQGFKNTKRDVGAMTSLTLKDIQVTRRRRQPLPQWRVTRARIWGRDQGKCQGQHCQHTLLWSLPLNLAHIDHILEVCKGGSNHDSNLRTLCRRCHVLCANHTHQGMIAAALRDGVIPANWRELVWED